MISDSLLLYGKPSKANKKEIYSNQKLSINRYAIIRIVEIIAPVVKSFEEARKELLPLYKNDQAKEALETPCTEQVVKH